MGRPKWERRCAVSDAGAAVAAVVVASIEFIVVVASIEFIVVVASIEFFVVVLVASVK